MIYLLSLSAVLLVAYGRVLEYHHHQSISLVLQLFIGGSFTIILNACGTLHVELHESNDTARERIHAVIEGSLRRA